MNREYDAMKIPELKAALKVRGESTTGRELIDRLKKADKRDEESRGVIEVYVKSMMGFCYDIKINKTSTILELKEKVFKKTGISPDKQKLYFVVNRYDYVDTDESDESDENGEIENPLRPGDLVLPNQTIGRLTNDIDILQDIGTVGGSFFHLHQSLR